ncbi:hypothetical protein [Streptomyces malaysiensis]|uniref:hypothetical protein n=1 Tax=Streptomyces malaysiensis TaxID=92644 RepID=UPI00142EE2B6|nr:hypothetical protein [Streptomyces malaysiensis]
MYQNAMYHPSCNNVRVLHVAGDGSVALAVDDLCARTVRPTVFTRHQLSNGPRSPRLRLATTSCLRRTKKQSPLDTQRIRGITDSTGDIAQRIHTADADKKGPLYDALGITISYEHTTRAATVRSRP